MKKLILFVLLGLAVIAGKTQTNYGYTYIGQRYEWLAGLFKALGLPTGDSARFQVGQHQRQGAVYLDTVNTSGSPNGFYIYEDPTGGNSPFWNRQTSNFQICQNRLLTAWNVSWQGTGYNFTVHGGQPTGQGSYQIGCSFYTEDSLTVTLSPSDATLERIDVIYLDATGIHVREGDLASPGLAQKPSVTLDEIELTFITVSPGTTEPTLTQLIVWNENTESTVTNIGTTTDPNNLTNVFIGLKSVNVTNVNHNDIIDFEKLPGGSAWQVLGYDALVLAIKLKPTMPINTSCNIAVSLIVGSSVVGTEVIVPVTKSNSSTYQQVSVPMSAFGNLSNTLITKVRVRYLFPTATGNVYSGFYLDYIYFVDGLNNPQTPGPAQFTLNMPIGFTVTPTNTQQSPGTWTVTNQAAAAGQYYTKEGWVTLPDFLNSIGPLDGQAKDADGGSVLGNVFYFQLADTTYPGLLSAELYRKISRNDSVTNGTPGDTLLVKLNDTTLLVKSLIAGTNISFDVGADSIVINATGGAGNPGEGITVTGDSIHLGGLISAPATPFSQNRLINTNRKGLYLVNGGIPDLVEPGGASWAFDQKTFAPFQFLSRDTIATNDIDPPTAAAPWTGVFARREIYFADGILRSQKLFGHEFKTVWNFKDSMIFNTQGGDYNNSFKVFNEIAPRGTGRQGIKASHGTNQNLSRSFGEYGVLSTTWLNSSGSNYIKVNGHLGGFNSYLVGNNASDSITGGFVYYGTGSFWPGYLAKSYVLAPSDNIAAPFTDSAFFLFDTARLRRTYHAGKSVWGISRGTSHAWASSDVVKVIGNVNITDSLVLGKASLIGDSTGYDWVIRRRTDGSLFRIRASDMSTFFSGSGGTFETVYINAPYTIADGVTHVQVLTFTAANTDITFPAASAWPGRQIIISTADAAQDIIHAAGDINDGEGADLIVQDKNATWSYVSDGTDWNQTRLSWENDFVASTGTGSSIIEPNFYYQPNNHRSVQRLKRFEGTGGITVTDDDVAIYIDGSGLGGGGTTETASNGLTKVVNDIQLGGPLTSGPTITSSGFPLTITGSVSGGSSLVLSNAAAGVVTALTATASDASATAISANGGNIGIQATTTNGIGIVGTSTNGIGIQATSSGNIAANFQVFRTTTNDVQPLISAARYSSGGNGANGIGGSIDLYNETSTGTGQLSTQLISELTDATNATRTGQFRVANINNGSINDVLKIAGAGQITFHSGYAAGTFAGTPAYNLAVDATGKLVTTTAGGGGGGGFGTVNTGTANRLAYYPASSDAVDDLGAITANRALISDANGLPTHATTTATEIGYVNGVTSAIQTQLDGKANTALSNLASVAVNTTIASDADNTDDLGTSSNGWKDIYSRTLKLDGATSGTVTWEAQVNAISPLITTATGQGYGCSCMEAREAVGSDFTGQNINTVQPMFATDKDVWPLQASTSYDFEGFLSLNHNATSHSVGLSFELSGGASVTSISYMTIAWVTAIGTNTASQTTNFIQATTNTTINAAGANATEQIYFKGTINMNAAGNVTPSYTFSAAPGGTALTKGGSFIKFCPKGTNTFTNQGPAN